MHVQTTAISSPEKTIFANPTRAKNTSCLPYAESYILFILHITWVHTII